MFLKFNNVLLEKGTKLNSESIMLTINFVNTARESLQNTIKIYINEIANVVSPPSTRDEFDLLTLSEPIFHTFNLSYGKLIRMNIDVTELVKKVINLDDWSSGNSIMFILKVDDDSDLYMKSYDFTDNPIKSSSLSRHISYNII